jgi:hypothetical protein
MRLIASNPLMTLETFTTDYPETVRLWFLTLAVADMNASETAARSAMEQLSVRDRKDERIYDALVEAAVVRYFRPFKRCKLPDGKGSIRLTAALVPAGYEDLHALIEATRDQSTAHSDMTVRPSYIRRHRRTSNSPLMWQAFTTSSSIDEFAVARLPGLTKGVRALLLPLVNELADKLMPDATFEQTFELTPTVAIPSPNHEEQFRQWDMTRLDRRE